MSQAGSANSAVLASPMGSAGVTGGDRCSSLPGLDATSDVPQVTHIQMYKWGGDWLAERDDAYIWGAHFGERRGSSTASGGGGGAGAVVHVSMGRRRGGRWWRRWWWYALLLRLVVAVAPLFRCGDGGGDVPPPGGGGRGPGEVPAEVQVEVLAEVPAEILAVPAVPIPMTRSRCGDPGGGRRPGRACAPNNPPHARRRPDHTFPDQFRLYRQSTCGVILA